MLDTLIGWHPSFAILALRLFLGSVFMAHGYPKLFKDPGPKGVSVFLRSLKFPIPLFFAYALGIAEVFGGLLLLAGLFTRLAALVIAVVMLVAMWKVKFRTGLLAKVVEGGRVGGYELDLGYFVIAISLAAIGGGVFSLDRLLL